MTVLEALLLTANLLIAGAFGMLCWFAVQLARRREHYPERDIVWAVAAVLFTGVVAALSVSLPSLEWKIALRYLCAAASWLCAIRVSRRMDALRAYPNPTDAYQQTQTDEGIARLRAALIRCGAKPDVTTTGEAPSDRRQGARHGAA